MKPRAKMPDVTVSGPNFNTAKERDKWVNKLIKEGKIKVYNSLTEFHARKKV